MKHSKKHLLCNGTHLVCTHNFDTNEKAPFDDEPSVMFGDIKMKILVYLYNSHISYANEEIFVSFADMNAYFHFSCINLDIVGAFGFLNISWIFC